MLNRIMLFLDRLPERKRLDRVLRHHEGGLVVVYGRRRVGKTRLLIEWSKAHGGIYTVADQSAANVQRRYVAEAIAARLAGFADVEYPDWRSLLVRLAREARASGWRGPIIFDELPNLVLASRELPSVLQHWIDHEAKEAQLVVAAAGSSQRMMQGLVLSAEAPLYGRAREIMNLEPIDVGFLGRAMGIRAPREIIQAWSAWGGIPRYWELAQPLAGSTADRVDELVLDPLGPLHREPDLLLMEEVPSALEVRPVLDAIGNGAHRASEIAARLGRPATSLSRPLDRLVEMGLVRREIPFGESERSSKRSLYKISDPFFRLWFRLVAPHRALLAGSARHGRVELLRKHWEVLVSIAWEDLCRSKLPHLARRSRLGRHGPWTPGSRWWQGAMPEWDVVSRSADGERILVAECRWSNRLFRARDCERAAAGVSSKPLPASVASNTEVTRALFVPATSKGVRENIGGVEIVTARDVLVSPARDEGTS